MSWGATSLDQGLPVEVGSGPASSTSIQQPVPPVERLAGGEGWANDAAAGNALHARDVLLEGLEQQYVLEARAELRSYLRARPTAITLLFEASAHLDAVFGEGCVKAIRLVHDDSEPSVFGIIFWPHALQRGREALAHFDQRWWLRNCNRAGGVVNFNIELT